MHSMQTDVDKWEECSLVVPLKQQQAPHINRCQLGTGDKGWIAHTATAAGGG
jgi:hypothetical protein